MLLLVNCAGMPLRVRKDAVLAYWQCNEPTVKSCILVGGCSHEWHLQTEYEDLQMMMELQSLDMGVSLHG